MEKKGIPILPDKKIPIQSEQEVKETKQRERAIAQLHDAFGTLLGGADWGGDFARHGEEGFSGDGASLVTFVSFRNESGEEIPQLVKVAWGEFSKETFAGDKYPAFHNFPLDVYCISQGDSFHAGEKLKKQMKEDPQGYLKAHSIFAARQGEVQLAEGTFPRNLHLDRDIQAVPYDEMLRTVRNQIITVRSTPEEFAGFLKTLPDDPTELGKHMVDIDRAPFASEHELRFADEQTKKEARKKHLLHYLWGMGVEQVGIAVGDRKASESVLALKNRFDFKTNSFR